MTGQKKERHNGHVDWFDDLNHLKRQAAWNFCWQVLQVVPGRD
jgi:hypothetical protein